MCASLDLDVTWPRWFECKKKFDRLLLILFTATFLKGKHNVLIMA